MWLRLACDAMGTRFELLLEDRARARAAGEAALEIVEQCDARLSRFRSDSLIARINRAAGGAWVRVDLATWELLKACEALRVASQGAFDATRASERHDAAELCFDPAGFRVRLSRVGAELDLGAIGKGHALDLAAERLRECGVERALLHGGTSSVIAIGTPDASTAWRVGLGAGFDDASVSLADGALSVSAARGGRGTQHLFDPRAGSVVEADSRCAVVAASAREADAWSTALLVLAARGPLDASPPALAGTGVEWVLRTAPSAQILHSPDAERHFRLPLSTLGTR